MTLSAEKVMMMMLMMMIRMLMMMMLVMMMMTLVTCADIITTSVLYLQWMLLEIQPQYVAISYLIIKSRIQIWLDIFK